MQAGRKAGRKVVKQEGREAAGEKPGRASKQKG